MEVLLNCAVFIKFSFLRVLDINTTFVSAQQEICCIAWNLVGPVGLEPT